MITAFNAFLECFVTAIFVGLILMGMAKLGWIPVLMFIEQDGEEKEAE